MADPVRSAEGEARSRESAGRRKLRRGDTLLLASHNAGKLRELRAMLAPRGITVISAAEGGLPEPAETGTTFHANAALKALAAARAANLPALADDSGCEVAALGGAPGVYTADWATQPDGSRDYAQAMARVAGEAGDTPDRRCAFVSVLCMAWPDGHTQFHEGRVDGAWVYPPRGGNGFGFDPMFIPAHSTLTFGEMTAEQKAADNHRSRAFAAFAATCLDE